MKKVFIYALINPITSSVFYIGATVSPKSRLHNHINCLQGSNKNKQNEIRLILSKDSKPEMEILDACSIKDAIFWEEFYIDLFSSYGYDLKQQRKSFYNSNSTTSTIKIKLKHELVDAMELIAKTLYTTKEKTLEFFIRERISAAIDDPQLRNISNELLNILHK